MSVFLDLRNGRPARDLSSTPSGSNGPVLGPFLGVHLTRDEVRVTTLSREVGLHRIGDWIYYSGALYADVDVIAEDQLGPRRKRRLAVFDPFLSDLAIEDLG
jgi:hypothetical protein